MVRWTLPKSSSTWLIISESMVTKDVVTWRWLATKTATGKNNNHQQSGSWHDITSNIPYSHPCKCTLIHLIIWSWGPGKTVNDDDIEGGTTNLHDDHQFLGCIGAMVHWHDGCWSATSLLLNNCWTNWLLASNQHNARRGATTKLDKWDNTYIHTITYLQHHPHHHPFPQGEGEFHQKIIKNLAHPTSPIIHPSSSIIHHHRPGFQPPPYPYVPIIQHPPSSIIIIQAPNPTPFPQGEREKPPSCYPLNHDLGGGGGVESLDTMQNYHNLQG